MASPTIVDLFAGCGGLSLGAHRAGFVTGLAIDADQQLTHSFGTNFPDTQLLQQDVRKVSSEVVRQLNLGAIDGVVGGPPCQAFSEMGRRLIDDPRRSLVGEFFRLVNLFEPKFFLFENVRGLGFEDNIELLHAGLDLLPQRWKTFGPTLLNAADFGAPTKRVRLFVIGFDSERVDVPDEASLTNAPKILVSVGDAIRDLATAGYVGKSNEFDVWCYDKRRRASAYATKLRSADGKFTGHQITEHTKKTLKRFSKIAAGGRDDIGKYVRLKWDGLCPTLRAGTGSDKGSYQAVRPIHPDQDRVITPREAARLQGFPDHFLFHPTVWHSCRMIGNSVSPIIAEALLSRIRAVLNGETKLKSAAE
jgi:DNA (cytosine-5)-methyltransferase 1